MPEIILPTPRLRLKTLPLSFLNLPFFYYYQTPWRFFSFLKRFTLVLEDRLAILVMAELLFVPLFRDPSIVGRAVSFVYRILRVVFGTTFLLLADLLLLILFLLWLILPPFLVLFSLREPRSLLPLIFVLLIVWWYASRRPRYQISEIEKQPLVRVDEVATRKVLAVLGLDSNQFLSLAHRFPRIRNLLQRLEVELPLKFSSSPLKIFRDRRVWEIAFREALETNADYLRTDHLFFGALAFEEMQDVSEQLNIKIEDLKGVLIWVYQMDYWRHPPRLGDPRFEIKRRGGINRAMLARVTPTLNQYSNDLTTEADKGRLPKIFGKEKVLEKMVTILSRSEKNNVLLLGEPGCGKTVTVGGLAQTIIEGGSDSVLWDKRLVRLHISSLLAGAKTRGEVEARLVQILEEIKAAGNVILFIDEIHRLAGEEQQVLSALEPYFADPNLSLIAADTWQNYRKFLEPQEAFVRIFETIELPEASFEQTLEVLKYTAWQLESEHRLTISYSALTASIKLAARFFHERVLPDKAVDLLDEAAALVRKAGRDFVGREDVTRLVSEKLKMPLSQITAEEGEALLDLEGKLHQRIVNQEEAVAEIAKAMRRARVGLRQENRPVASLLFVGPTGVGKTEMAKALAESYFGSEEKMIRFDMSEYQTPESVDRLLDSPPLERLRRQPFSLVLLDEFEKAREDVLNVFLQVLEDGRLTSTEGRTIDFANSIIIATSNVGAHLIFENLEKGFKMVAILPQLEDEIQRVFAPELLNRFDGIIYCNGLSLENVQDVARLMIKRVEKSLAEKEIKLEITDEAVAELARQGYTPSQGARPLRRLIQDKIESQLAEKILSGEVKKGETVRVDLGWLRKV
jgi:ATP-dependent Clp protease ATP-binding subunit ClpC